LAGRWAEVEGKRKWKWKLRRRKRKMANTYRDEGLYLLLLEKVFARYEHPKANKLDDTPLFGNQILVV